jgi:1-acyl-sn-glycerol-3-phosphate acyltransferase
MRTALRQLAAGRVVGIFPEGRISTAGDLQDFQTGVALMAIRAKAPVYPAYLDGTQRNRSMTQAFLHRANSVINFGPAVEFDRSGTDREHLEKATVAIRSAVQNLRFSVDEFRKFR